MKKIVKNPFIAAMYSAISHIRNSRAALSSFSSSTSSLIRIHGGFSTFSPFFARSPAPPGPNQETNRNMKP
ncbi:hypothetical protein LINGRAPRIM_LOCUS2327 [Linum grandiflorum]